MKNNEVEPLGNFILSLELKGKHSRMRTRFVKVLQERASLIQEERTEIVKQYAFLDEKGEPKTYFNEGQELYDIRDVNEFNLEINDFMNEEFVIEVTVANKEMIESVRNSILDCDMSFSGGEAMAFDRYCEIIEGEE